MACLVRVALALALACAPARPVAAAAPADQAVPIPTEARLGTVASPPVIDGRLEEGEWAGATRLALAYQIEPGDNVAASEPTDVYLAADATHLFIAFHARDRDPAALRARVVKRDEVSREDWVGVHLDTFDNRQRAYLFRFNPLGVQEDGIYTDAAPFDVSWDGLVESYGAVTADGYVVEAAIAWSRMRYRAGPGARWGLTLQRRIARRAETTSWLPRSRDVSGLLQQAGRLAGLDDVPVRSSISLIPTITGARTWSQPPGAGGASDLESAGDWEAALTAIWAMTPTATVSATANPDFSQIEADVPQIDVNQRFALFYPERRPFFLEGTEVFAPLSEDLIQLLDTRQIVDPDWGLKFTGRVGAHAVGAIASSDRAPGLRVDAAHPSSGSNATIAAVRVQRDVLEDSAVGVFASDRRFAGSSNTVVAFDGRLRLSPATQLLVTIAGTRASDVDDGPDAETAAASDVRVNHVGRHWRFYLGNRYVGPAYRNDTGFIDRVDYHEQAVDVGYEWRPKPVSNASRWLVYVWPYLDGRYSRVASDGSPEVQYLDPAVKLQFQRDVSANCYPSFHREGFAGRTLRYTFAACDYAVGAFKLVSLEGSFQAGEGVYYDPDVPVVGRQRLLSNDVTVKPSDALSLGLVFLTVRLTDPDSGAPLVDQRILRGRVAWQWTRFHALRAIVEHDTASGELGTSLLYSWTPSPNTALFFGWNDQLVGGGASLLDRPTSGWIRSRGTVFAKLSVDVRR